MTWLCWLQSWHSVLLVLAAQPRQPSRATDWWQGNGGGKRAERCDQMVRAATQGIIPRPGQGRPGTVSWDLDRLMSSEVMLQCPSVGAGVWVLSRWGPSEEWAQPETADREEAGAQRLEVSWPRTGMMRSSEAEIRGETEDWDQGDAETARERLHLLYYHWHGPECWPIRGRGWGRCDQSETSRGRQLPALILSMMKRAESRERHSGGHGHTG